ncbi:SDR family NAD(P)-dependent oxidoreductase [Streptomyces sp. NPDC057199]|uniref:SDR family NAD(P)-dependent oxidoreductase n=1 Tax=Streptomyces sp. NPDC057199 TaxID=3346047 RepID=UPI003631D1A7
MNTNSTARIAVVTGGNRGLGRSATLALAADGVDIVLTFRSHEEEAKEVAMEIEALGRTAVVLRLDTTQTESFPAFVDALRGTLSETWGRDSFDILVNNAGVAGMTPLGGTDVDSVRRLLEVHFVGVVMLTQVLAPHLVDRGRIINTSTGLARFTGEFAFSVYASAKGAVEVYTRYLAKELGPRRITVNSVAPGPSATDFAGGVLRDDEQVRSHLSGLIAMGGVGDPDDIGSAVAAIASERMGWVTGQRIEASGGMLL